MTKRTLSQSRSDAPHRSAQHGRWRRRIAATVAAVAAAGTAYTTAGAATPNRQPATPSQCILLNGGDYNACNVGHTGSGDQPYTIRTRHTPNDCILLNGGDYNACNVGNSGRGDLAYKPVK
jgi:roadblock/LC7 domain-containing protein